VKVKIIACISNEVGTLAVVLSESFVVMTRDISFRCGIISARTCSAGRATTGQSQPGKEQRKSKAAFNNSFLWTLNATGS
jgi:hypothetical protein